MPASVQQQDLSMDGVLSVAVDQAFDAVMVTSPDGVIVYVNKAFEKMTGYSAIEALGATPRILKSGRQDAAFYEVYWRELLSGSPWHGRLVNRRKNGELYVEKHTATPVFDDQGLIQFLIAVGRDVTEQERTLEMLESTVALIGAAAEMDDALESTVRLVCESTRWAFGEAWAPSVDGSELVCVQSWAEEEGLDGFRLASQPARFRRGEGLPGRVWESLKPEWQSDVWRLHPAEFPRKSAAQDAGLHAGFGVPIVFGGEALAVLCFFVREVRDEDAHLVRVVSAMAAQLGEHFARKRAEIETRRLAAIVESSVDAIIGMDVSGIITSWNRGAEKLYWYLAEEMIGQTKARIVPPDRMDELNALTSRALRGLSTPEVDTVRLGRDGRVIDVMLSISPVEGPNGQPVGVATVARDITEKRRAERALLEQDYALREAQRVAKVGSWHWVRGSGERSWSEEACRIFGWDAAAPVPGYGELLRMYSPDSARGVDAAMQRALHEGTAFGVEAEHRCDDGTRVDVLLRGEPIRDDSGAVVAFRGTVQDISDRKRAQEAFLQSQKLDSIGRLAGGVAHDFNNLLTAIEGFTHLAASGLPADHPARADLDEVVACVNRGADLTQQLLAFSRQQPVLASVVDANEVLGDIERLLRRLIGDDIRVACQLAPERACLLMDRGQLEQVLMNLAINARDAMPKGGTLAFSLELTGPEGAPSGIETTAARFVRLRVEDSGEGIAETVLPHVFEPFFTTKGVGKGTGLGLSTCYGIVKQAGGEITVKSWVGLGTTFDVYLPHCEHSPESAAGEPGTGTATG